MGDSPVHAETETVTSIVPIGFSVGVPEDTGSAEALMNETQRLGGVLNISGGSSKTKIRPFRKRSVEWLKKEAKLRGISGYSKKKKGELVEMLKGSKPVAKSSESPDNVAYM